MREGWENMETYWMGGLQENDAGVSSLVTRKCILFQHRCAEFVEL